MRILGRITSSRYDEVKEIILEQAATTACSTDSWEPRIEICSQFLTWQTPRTKIKITKEAGDGGHLFEIEGTPRSIADMMQGHALVSHLLCDETRASADCYADADDDWTPSEFVLQSELNRLKQFFS